MAISRNQIAVELQLKGAKYINGLRRARQETASFAQRTVRSISAMRSAWFGIIAIIAVRFAQSLTNAAMRAEETQNKFNVVFRGIEERANQTATALARDFALSNEEAQRLLSNTADILMGFGATSDQALELSNSVQRLAGDLGSFNNIPTAQAAEAITAALTGERERMKALGVVISETAVQQEVMRRGQSNLRGEALLLARAQATVSLITRQSQNAIGDFSRSANSAANVSRRLSSNLADIAVEAGQSASPGVDALRLSFVRITQEGTAFRRIMRAIGNEISRAAERLADFITIIDRMTSVDDVQAMTSQQLLRLRMVVALSADAARNAEDRAFHLERIRRIEAELRQRGVTIPDTNVVTETTETTDDGGGGGGGGRGPRKPAASIDEGLSTEVITETKLNEMINLEKEAQERRVQTWSDAAKSIISVTQEMFNEISTINQMALSNELANIENKFNTQRRFIEATVTDEKKRTEQLAAIDQQEELRKKLAQIKAAKSEKQIKTFSTLLEIPTAAFRAYSSLAGIPIVGPALGAAAAIAATALGFKKLQLIQSAPLPQLESGGIIQPSRMGTQFVAGENYTREAIVPLDRMSEFINMGNGNNVTNVYIGNEQLISHVDRGRDKKASLMGASNYSFRSVYT